MQFASPIPWWAAVLAAVAIGVVAVWSYRQPLAPLTRAQRWTLTLLRALALALVVVFVCRPVLLLPPVADRDLVVPVLVDVSRSMRIADADGGTRLARAAAIVERDIIPSLAGTYTPEVYAVGESWSAAQPTDLRPDSPRSNLAEAVDAIREQYRGRRVPGIVLISDGATTGSADPRAAGAPVFSVGVGSPAGPDDREIVGLTAGDPRLDQTSIDLRVSAVSRGYGRSPFQLRFLANGRLLESRAITPPAEGSPVEEVIAVSPDPLVATVYTAEIAAADGEAIVENNTRSVLVSPIGRKRRILALAGAPGYEFSFLSRALGKDPGLEFDSIVRKGQNESGQSTFLVQAGGGRASALTSGFPSSREALYAYDALIAANVEGDALTRAQLTMAAEFVSVRGGGLVVLGGRSFAQRGLIGTPLEETLPVELNDRRGGLARAQADAEGPPAPNAILLTGEGESHPAMRIGQTVEETRKRWAALPALAASAPVGGPRPGATVLAVTMTASGGRYPVVAAQRYGRGRSMIFAGEASWRWRMLTPASDRTYEYFWRQAARWLAASAPDPVSVIVPAAAEPGSVVQIEVEARDAAFTPLGDATVTAAITGPGGTSQPLTLRPDAEVPGRFAGQITAEVAGLYRVQGEARRGARSLGPVDAWFQVGGVEREFADPRLNAGFLQRLARASGGEYLTAAEAGRLASLLASSAPRALEPERRDLWHEPWTFVFVVALLSAEWILRRRWGLR
jgi:uncharacterized membrane protein